MSGGIGGGENGAAWLANTPAVYDHRRRPGGAGMELDPLPTHGFRMETTCHVLRWCWDQQPGVAPGVLDVAAGVGSVGEWAHRQGVRSAGAARPFAYHATEQSAMQCEQIRFRVPGSSACEWRCEPGPISLSASTPATPATPDATGATGATGATDEGFRSGAAVSLTVALGTAEDVFWREYPTVLVSHGVEHHADPYLVLDEAWSLVRPGGFLVLVSARNDPHRSHFRQYDWDLLLATAAHYAGFGNPIVAWEIDAWADLFCAVPKPGAEA